MRHLIFSLISICTIPLSSQNFDKISYRSDFGVDRIFTEDIDLDGDIDILTTDFRNGEDIFFTITNNGTDSFSFEESVIMDNVNFRGSGHGDLNNDGLTDLLFSVGDNLSLWA